jgi:predicted PurR-regulated permease PerM
MSRRIDSLLFFAATASGVFVCALMAAPFLAPITGALTLAIIITPLHERIERKLKQQTLAALVSTFLSAVVIVLTAFLVIQKLASEAAAGSRYVQSQLDARALQSLIDRYPHLAPIGDWIVGHIDLRALFAPVATRLSDIATSLVRASLVQFVGFVLTFYLLFYFLRDRRIAVRLIASLLPLTPAESDRLFPLIKDTVLAAIYGTLFVSAIQGALGGLMFWLLDLPTPVTWGVIMAVLSIVPVLGAFVIWIPAVVVLALDGDWTKAIVLALWGAVVVGGIDNVLRPIIVGDRLRLHTVAVFISIVGGLFLFGAAGFILGPLVVTVTTFLVTTWRERTHSRVAIPDLALSD